MITVTISCPVTMQYAANEFAGIIGNGLFDRTTFGRVQAVDADGNIYDLTSVKATDAFPQTAASDLAALAVERYGENHGFDVAAAQQAQQALVVWAPQLDLGTGKTTLGPPADSAHLTAVVHSEPHQALEWLGLLLYRPSSE